MEDLADFLGDAVAVLMDVVDSGKAGREFSGQAVGEGSGNLGDGIGGCGDDLSCGVSKARRESSFWKLTS